ncbi:MAG: chemotaxis protein CheW [Holophagaceae bacterium]|nr:chemotaxis protein CheW [Holophagaceae bacterium]
MSEQGSWLHVRASGMDLALSTLDLREVVGMETVSPLPGRPQGIQGVVVFQGEFLPVLAWVDLPGCAVPTAPPMAMAVLRPRLAIPIERMIGVIDAPAATFRDIDEDDPATGWAGGLLHAGGLDLRLLDPDRLIALLRRFRGDR